jgi:hypothetical protein
MPQTAEALHPDLAEIDQRLDAVYAQHIRGAVETVLPLAVRPQDLPEEAAVQAEFARGLGALPVGVMVERPAHEAEPHSPTALLEYIDRAIGGDRAAAAENAKLALTEALVKRGVAEVTVTQDEKGCLVQHDVPLHDVVAKAIAVHPGDHPELHKVTQAEGLYMHTWDMLVREGYFKQGYVWVTLRQAPRNVPGQPLRRYGYFENLAVAGAVVWQEDDGTFTMRSIFMDGTPVDENEEVVDRAMTYAEVDAMYDARIARRHDLEAVADVYRQHGLPPPASTFEGQRGFLVHRSQLKNTGYYEADVAEWYDNALGPEHFYGRPEGRRDYVEFSKQCLRTMNELTQRTDAVVDELIAMRPYLDDDMAAAKVMASIARRHAIDHVLDSPHIDPRSSLGVAAALDVMAYQRAMDAGDMAAAAAARQGAHGKARVNMCGFGDEATDRARPEDKNSSSELTGGDSTESANHGTLIECSYTFDGCYCSPYDYDGTPRDEPMKVLVIANRHGVATCQRSGCGAALKTKYDKHGNVIGSRTLTKGGIYQQAQLLVNA